MILTDFYHINIREGSEVPRSGGVLEMKEQERGRIGSGFVFFSLLRSFLPVLGLSSLVHHVAELLQVQLVVPGLVKFSKGGLNLQYNIKYDNSVVLENLGRNLEIF